MGILKHTLAAAAAILIGYAAYAEGNATEKATVENAVIEAARMLSLGAKPETLAVQLERLVPIDPENDALRYYLALCQFRSGKTREAGENFLEAVRLDPDNTDYQEMLSSYWYAVGEKEKSIAIQMELLEKHPGKYTNERTLTTLADNQLSQGKDSLALENYEKALMCDPSYIPATLGKSEVYRMRGNFPAFFLTLKDFTSNPGIEAYPKCEYVEQILNHVDGRFYRSWGPQLDSMVNSCMQAHPKDSSALKMAGRWYYGTGRTEQARNFFRELLDSYPEDIDAHYIILNLHSIDEDYEGVIAEAQRIFDLSGNDRDEQVRALNIIGDTYQKLGKNKLTYKFYDKALKIKPDYVPVLNNYAYFLCLDGKKLGKAEQMSRKTIEAEPENPTYLDTYGWILHLRGRDAEAKPVFKKAITHGGNKNAEVLLHYSLVLEALGEKDLAIYYKGLSENRK